MDIFSRVPCPRCAALPLVLRLVRDLGREAVIVAECVMCGHEYEVDRSILREAVA